VEHGDGVVRRVARQRIVLEQILAQPGGCRLFSRVESLRKASHVNTV